MSWTHLPVRAAATAPEMPYERLNQLQRAYDLDQHLQAFYVRRLELRYPLVRTHPARVLMARQAVAQMMEENLRNGLGYGRKPCPRA